MTEFQKVINNIMSKRLEFRNEVVAEIFNRMKLSSVEEAESMGFTLALHTKPNGDETVAVMDGDVSVIAYDIESRMEKEDGKYVMSFKAVPIIKNNLEEVYL